jgi:hypothetical protein
MPTSVQPRPPAAQPRRSYLLPARFHFFAVFALACLPTFLFDLAADGQISFWGFYLVPVALAGWLRGRNFGMLIALVGIVGIVAAPLIVGHRFDQTWQLAVSIGNRAASLLIVAWLTSVCRRVSELQSQLNSYRGESTFLGER